MGFSFLQSSSCPWRSCVLRFLRFWLLAVQVSSSVCLVSFFSRSCIRQAIRQLGKMFLLLSSFWFWTMISVTGLVGVAPRFLGGASSFLPFFAYFCCFLLILAVSHFSVSFWKRASTCLASYEMSTEVLSKTLGPTSLEDLPEVGLSSNVWIMFVKASLAQLSMAKVMPSAKHPDPCTSVVSSFWQSSTFTLINSLCCISGTLKNGVVVGSPCMPVTSYCASARPSASPSASASARRSNSRTMSRTDARLLAASQVASASQKSFHLTRYSALPLRNRLARIFSTSKYCSTTF